MGYNYIKNPGISELENLNLKVGYFTLACKFSTLSSLSINSNFIAKLSYLEIWKIMNNNKNLYSKENINHVYEKFQHFSNNKHSLDDDHDDHDDDLNNKNLKRVKFV
ncbi:hypothetical protein C6P42_004558 [Pichia californica]|nr:hypothetical protein C6P42_004558 [[Candida] californica]